jgi:zinc transport system permease protein
MEYDFLTKALMAGSILGFILPVIGVFLILKKYSFISDSISHLTINGLIIGKVLGLNSNFVAVISALIAGIVIEKVRQKAKVSSDNILAIILSGGLGFSLILLSIFKSTNISISSLLFGSILTVNNFDLAIISVLTIISTILIRIYFKQLFAITFDEEFAKVNGVKTQRFNYLLIILSSIAIGISIQIMGSLLIGGLIVIPVNIALSFKKNFKQTLVISIIAAQIMNIIGISLSVLFNLPSGASIIIFGIIIYIIALIYNRN